MGKCRVLDEIYGMNHAWVKMPFMPLKEKCQKCGEIRNKEVEPNQHIRCPGCSFSDTVDHGFVDRKIGLKSVKIQLLRCTYCGLIFPVDHWKVKK